jgi:hypothetical protein
MPNIERTPLQTFRRITEILTVIDAKQYYSEELMKQASLALHENWNSNQDSFPEFQEPDTKQDAHEQVKLLMKVLSLIDVKDRVTPLLLDHPEEDKEELEEMLQRALFKSKLSSNEAFVSRMIALNALHLGIAFAEMGNKQIGLHMLLVAISIHERLIRMTPRTPSDERISYVMYEKVMRVGNSVQQYDVVVDYGSKLVHKLEIALTSALENQTALLVNFDSSAVQFDFAKHFENLMILVAASRERGQVSTTTYAIEQAIDLFGIEKRFGVEGSILKFLSQADKNSELEQIPKSDDKEEILLYLCLELIKANDTMNGDPLLSLKFSRSALEHFALSELQSQKPNLESEMQFLCGTHIYKYALYLAGGMAHASSPPIAILPPAANQPTVKSLLEESMDKLEEASKIAEPGMKDAHCKEAIQLQMAIIATELRMEPHAKKLLAELQIDAKILNELDESAKQNKIKKQFPHYLNVVYSAEVFKRLVLLVTPQSTARKLTLSRKRTMNFDQPQKVLCSYCCMQCINSDLKCEYCAVGKVYVWYCTDECKNDHAQQHEGHCLKNKSEKGIDFRSFLNVLG